MTHHSSRPIRDFHSLTTSLLRSNHLRLHLQKILLIERIERPQNLIPLLYLLLTTSHRCELIIHQQAPKLGISLGARANGSDEVISEGIAVGAIIGELCEFGSGVQDVGRGV